jgi:hypothetical protein
MWRWSSWRNSAAGLPAYSTLDRLAAEIRTEVNGGFHRLVAARWDAGARARMPELLIVDPRSRRSRLAELTRPAPTATVTRLTKHLTFLRWLDELGATQEWLAGGPAGESGARRRKGRGGRCW